jgi:hypothetical protein
MNPTPPNPTPKPPQTDDSDAILVVFDGPGDKTRRPRRKHIPLPPPDDQTPPTPPEKAPEDKK